MNSSRQDSKIGSFEISTEIAGLRVHSANRYTIESRRHFSIQNAHTLFEKFYTPLDIIQCTPNVKNEKKIETHIQSIGLECAFNDFYTSLSYGPMIPRSCIKNAHQVLSILLQC